MEHQTRNLPPCKNFFDCALISSDPKHSASFLHGCPFGSSCPDLKNKEHMLHFYHFELPLCPNGKDCPYLIEIEHRITYHHPGERDFLLPCAQKRKCPNRRDPQHTSMYQHGSEAMYPSLPSDLKARMEGTGEPSKNWDEQEEKKADFILSKTLNDVNVNEVNEAKYNIKEVNDYANITNYKDNNISRDTSENELSKKYNNKSINTVFDNFTYFNDGVIDLIDNDDSVKLIGKTNKTNSKKNQSISTDKSNNSRPKTETQKRKRSLSPIKSLQPSSAEKDNLHKEPKTKKRDIKKMSFNDTQRVIKIINTEACAMDIKPAAQLKSMKMQLHNFQLQALSWMKMREEKGNGGVLCDEYGLGKTVEIIALIVSSQRRPTLVVVPPALLEQWKEEINMHVKKEHDLKVCVFNELFKKECIKKGNSEKIFMEYDVVIVDFNSVEDDWKSNGPILKKAWYRVVVDDINTTQPHFFEALSELKSRKKWCVTEFPIQNSLMDLWNLISFVEPDPESKISDEKQFKKCIINPFMSGEISDDLKEFVKTYFIRRTRSMTTEEGNPLIQFPSCHTENIFVALKPIAGTFYSEIEKLALSEIQCIIKRGSSNSYMEQVFVLLLRLRQCIDHPFIPLRFITSKETSSGTQRWNFEELFKYFSVVMSNKEFRKYFTSFNEDDEISNIISHTKEFGIYPPPEKRVKESEIDESEDDDILGAVFDEVNSNSAQESNFVTSIYNNGKPKKSFSQEGYKKELGETSSSGFLAVSPKIEAIIDLYKKHIEKESNSKIVIFSCFNSFLDLIQYRLCYENIPVRRIIDSDDSETHKTVVSTFKESKGPMIILATHVSNRVSLDLTCANVVIISDPWWNPAVDLQAIWQVHRIGQEKDVYVYKLFTQNSLEEKMKTVIEKSFGENNENVSIKICDLLKEFISYLNK